MTKPLENKNPFTHTDYEVINREVMYQGVFRLARYQLRYRLFKEGWSQTVSREVLERLSAVALLPYDPRLDQVILIEQFRPGALAQSTSPWLIEIVAGVLDSDEKLEEVAIREAKEEAGCVIQALCPIHDCFISPGGSNEYLTIYCGKIDAKAIDGIYGLEEENEDIRAYALPAEEAFEKLRAGYIKTVPAIIALQWLQINRQSLRELWLEKN